MEEVVVSEPGSTAALPEARIFCRVCQKQFSRYTCPRCNSRYCSLECYKKHSLRCTESFMRENVMVELQHVQAEDETKRKMLDILKRFHSDEEMDYDDEDDSMLAEETIQKVLSGNEIKLEDLSPEEIKQFRRAVASGELSKMIQPWTPWWTRPTARAIYLCPDGSQPVRPHEQEWDMAHPSNTPEENLSEIPAGPESLLPPLSQLSRTDPSPLLAVHLVDILYSYCFTLRLYNGDWQCDPLGAAMVVLSISVVLCEDGRPETVAEALGACLERTCSPNYRHAGGLMFGCGLVDDIITLLSLGRNALICLLCDLQRMLRAGERMLKSEEMEKAKSRESSHKLRSAERKAYFLMCWIHEQPSEAWSSLASLVEVEKASLSALGHDSRPLNAGRKGLSQAKVLIEEV